MALEILKFKHGTFLFQTFFTWKLRLYQNREAECRFQLCQKLKLHDVIERWHLWTAGKNVISQVVYSRFSPNNEFISRNLADDLPCQKIEKNYRVFDDPGTRVIYL
jgi:hypothetical protein